MADYPMPHWLQPADPSKELLSGYQAGASVAEANAKLQAESNRVQAELQMQQQQTERQAARQQQMLEMTKAWHDQQTGIKQQAIAQQAQKIQLATQMAANKFAAQQGYDQYASQLIQQGVPEQEAYAHAGLKFGPTMGMSAAPFAALTKGAKAYGDIKNVPIPGGATAVYREGSPGVHVIPPPRQAQIPASAYASLAQNLPGLAQRAKNAGPDSPEAQLLNQIMEMLKRGQAPAPEDPKVQRADQLHAEHPDWNRQQIIDAVRGESYQQPQPQQ